MSKRIRAVLYGLAVAFFLGYLLRLAGARSGFALIGPVFFGLIAWLVFANLANNRKLVGYSPAEQQALLAAAAAPGYGLLYVCRSGFMGWALGIDVQVDGRETAQLKSGYFVRLELPAGWHMLSAGPKGIASAQNRDASLNVQVMEGSALVIGIGLGLGMLKNSVVITPEPNFHAGWAKLGTMRMVRQPGTQNAPLA